MKHPEPLRYDWLDHLLDELLRASQPIRRWQAVALSISVLAGVVTLDALLGNVAHPDILYTFPVVIAAWSAGRADGLGVAFLSAFAMVILDRPVSGVGVPGLPLLMVLMRLSALIIISLTVSKLRSVTEEAERLAGLDPLTGLLNRRSIEARLSVELARSARQSSNLSLIYIDVDDFKSYNDRYGHGAGDDILRAVASCVGESLRTTDVVARVGGDEFVVVLPDTDSDGAQRVGTELLAGFAKNPDARGAHISAGAVTFIEPPESPEAAIARADHLMYAAKRQGKDCLVCEIAIQT